MVKHEEVLTGEPLPPPESTTSCSHGREVTQQELVVAFGRKTQLLPKMAYQKWSMGNKYSSLSFLPSSDYMWVPSIGRVLQKSEDKYRRCRCAPFKHRLITQVQRAIYSRSCLTWNSWHSMTEQGGAIKAQLCHPHRGHWDWQNFRGPYQAGQSILGLCYSLIFLLILLPHLPFTGVDT